MTTDTKRLNFRVDVYQSASGKPGAYVSVRALGVPQIACERSGGLGGLAEPKADPETLCALAGRLLAEQVEYELAREIDPEFAATQARELAELARLTAKYRVER